MAAASLRWHMLVTNDNAATPVPNRAYYSDLIEEFLGRSTEEILGTIARHAQFSIEDTQRNAWVEQIRILRSVLPPYVARGKIYFEYAVPRLGRRIDVVLLIDHVIFVVEFKVGEKEFATSAIDQVVDYSVDLKNFHETTHDKTVAPILIPTLAKSGLAVIATTPQNDGVLLPVCAAVKDFECVIEQVLAFTSGSSIQAAQWDEGRYRPTPTIIEAAMALYAGHGVAEISRSDACAVNLSETSSVVARIIQDAKQSTKKSICFVTGVPGAGKTLVGLDIATTHIEKNSELYSVFLSGNGPLVDILREALARDKVRREQEQGRRFKKGRARSEVKLFIQNVHHFRDECLADVSKAPIEHVAIFDEAQRAWNLEQTASFMSRKKGRPDFDQSEPEFLISCLNRHKDWAVVVCLVGGGQEINTGEAGIGEWVQALQRSFRDWHVYISSRLQDEEYGAATVLTELARQSNVHIEDHLHLSTSMRSFRAEDVSALIKQVLDRDLVAAKATLEKVRQKYPLVVTRSVSRAKEWLKEQARGTERYGLVVSSQALRLKPHAIDVRSPLDPIHWFLDLKDDVRSSYYLEDAATEFHVQGLELDWACVVWDADFRYATDGWRHHSFVGSKWTHIHKTERQTYLKNAYRVLLTRARQGMVIVVPEGLDDDPTRNPAFYDPTYEYLCSIGFNKI